MVMVWVLMLLCLVLLDSVDSEGVLDWGRRLISSNCIIIERGAFPPYSKCFGCEVERAVNCIHDFKSNATGNIAESCNIHALSEVPQPNCCPKFNSELDWQQRKISTTHSGYPEAFECLVRVGCKNGLHWTDLEQECLDKCPPEEYTYYNGATVCNVFQSTAPRMFASSRAALVANAAIAFALLLGVWV